MKRLSDSQHIGSWTIASLLTVGLSIFATVLARIFTLASQIFIARRLTIADYGMYTTLYALLNPVLILSSLGLDVWLLRQSTNQQYVKQIVPHIIWLRLFLTTLLTLVTIPLIWLQYSEWSILVIMLAGANVILDVITTTGDTILRTQLRPLTSAGLQVGITLIVIGLLGYFRHTQLSTYEIIVFRVVASLVGVFSLGWMLRQLLHWKWQPSVWVSLTRKARIYFASELLANITLRGDLTLLAFIIGSSATALYSPVLTIVNTTFLLPNIASQVLLPIVSRQPISSRSYKFTVIASLVASFVYGAGWFILLFFYARTIINISFGSAYIMGESLLPIMAAIPGFKAFNFCWATLMIAGDQQKLRAKLQSLGAITNLGGNLICIPLFGIVGAAWINLLTEGVLLLAYSYGYWQTWHYKHA